MKLHPIRATLAILSTLITGTLLYLYYFTGMDVPDWWAAIYAVIITFYFTARKSNGSN